MISLKGCARNGSFKSVDIVTTESNAEATATSKNGVNLVGETLSPTSPCRKRRENDENRADG
jgi:hypothetical protein